ncbi:MAG: methyltransferase domain-containing protein [Pseudomonadota bacterium]
MDFETARRLMVDSQVRPNDVPDARIQDALFAVAREEFLPAGLKDQAYVEKEIAYSGDRSLVTARDFAKLLAAAQIGPNDLVLDVAFGAGYSTAVLAHLCAMVVAVDADEEASAAAEAQWSEMALTNAAAITGDPLKGAASEGPFDVILMAFATEVLPDALKAQLSPDGGRLAAILRINGVSKGVCLVRAGDTYTLTEHFDATAALVPSTCRAPAEFAF